jgi:ribonuclease Y
MIYTIIAGIVGLLIGIGGGFLIFKPKTEKIHEQAEKEAKGKLENAQKESERLISTARSEAQKTNQRILSEESQARERITNLQKQADERIEKRETTLEQKIEKAEEKREKYEDGVRKMEEKEEELQEAIQKQNGALESIAKLSQEEARTQLFDRMEKDADEALAETLKRRVELMHEKADDEAGEVLARAIQRLASSTTNETTTSAVKIDSEEMKGKIIGREGRNINAFEMMSGVDVIIDDTPGTITISCFDMFRRYVAKVALEKLLKDGRINPSKIEEALKKAQDSTDKLILELGQKSANEIFMEKLPDAVLKLIGRLRFRTSYGQNVLNHSIEVAYLAEGIANEIPGADAEVCRKAGFLHDIGKAVSHELEGGHAIIGMEILEKFNIDPRIVTAMKSHHEDFPYESIEARILQAADAISASRPGARRDTLEKYLRRLKELESISGSFSGVEKVYAIQAGREVRVFVNAHEMTDATSEKLSFDIARKIEKECQYPGEVQVAVIRENRFRNVAK